MPTTSFTKSTPSSNDVSSRLNDGTAGGALKEVRAREHARHQTRERQEHLLARERKEKTAAVRVLGLKVARGAKLVRRLSMESWDGEVPEEETQTSVHVGATTPGTPAREQAHDVSKDSDRKNALTLGDVISKPRRIKAKQLDFEVVPPLRAVIVLDDIDTDTDTDEPWEYITRASVNDGSAWKGKSYAQAVASAV